MTPVRVACVITRLEGGAGVLALRGAMALNPADFEVTIVTGPSSGRLPEQARAAGFEVIVEPALCPTISPRKDLRALRALTRLFRSRSFAVVHTNCAKAGTIGRLAAHKAKIEYIVHTYHGFPFHDFQWFYLRALYIRIERRLGAITNLALAVGSGVAAQAVARRLIAPERIRTIRIAVGDGGIGRSSAGLDSGARRRARAALGLADDVIVVGAVGRLTFQKSPETFVDALAEIDCQRTVGVWIGGGELSARIARRARAKGVRLLLAGERPDVADLLPAFDVFVLPSRYEGLPTAVAEAMVAGVPVVATAVNAVPDLVIPGETGLLVAPQRPEMLADAVSYLLHSPFRARQMAQSARNLIDERFSVGALARSLTAAYSGACRLPASPEITQGCDEMAAERRTVAKRWS